MATKFDKGKLRFDLVPADAMAEVALAYTVGANKYGDRNWESSDKFPFSRLIAAAHRHINQWQRGENRDPDGQHHLAAAVFCLLSLLAYQLRGAGADDREMVADKQSSPPREVTQVTQDDRITICAPVGEVVAREIERMKAEHPPLTNILNRAALIFASEVFEVIQAVKKYTPGGVPSHCNGLTEEQIEHLMSELGQVISVSLSWIENLAEAKRRIQK